MRHLKSFALFGLHLQRSSNETFLSWMKVSIGKHSTIITQVHRARAFLKSSCQTLGEMLMITHLRLLLFHTPWHRNSDHLFCCVVVYRGFWKKNQVTMILHVVCISHCCSMSTFNLKFKPVVSAVSMQENLPTGTCKSFDGGWRYKNLCHIQVVDGSWLWKNKLKLQHSKQLRCC